MHLKSIEGDLIEISDGDAKYSPFLDGAIECSEASCIDTRFSTRVLREYVSFLNGATPSMDEEIYECFNFIGHPNVNEYPLDYWAIKLHDNWIRDHMYSRKLWEDPYYDLVEVPIVNPMPTFKLNVPLPKGAYIAGGLPAWMAGYTTSYHDIDIFFTSTSAMDDIMLREYEHIEPPTAIRPYELRHVFYKYGGEHMCILTGKDISSSTVYKCRNIPIHQLIRRLYKAPTEIVHGFDVDVCGVLWDGKKLWATKRAIYASRVKKNWFDPDRASPSYAYRLSKYMARGIDIGLVGLDTRIVLKDRIVDMWMKIQKRIGIIRPSTNIQHMGIMFRNVVQSLSGDDWNKRRLEMVRMIPKDPGSILILSSMYDFHTGYWKIYDYQSVNERQKMKRLLSIDEIKEYLSNTPWKEQNPMEQVSSTFYPTPIERISEWWMKSPLVNPDLPWPMPVKPRQAP